MSTRQGLWSFSLRVYAAPGVPDWCLAQQDRFGADVNVLLWAAWLGAGGRLLAAADVAAAEAATAPWRDGVVRPLRGARRAMRGDLGAVSAAVASDLRGRIKALELEAERLEQSVLERVVPVGPAHAVAPERAVAANLALCLARVGADPAAPPPALIAAAMAGTCNESQ